MTKPTTKGSFGKVPPTEFRCPVIGGNQFQLPAQLVREVGFKSPQWSTVQSAKVLWYYHEEDEKAVLANNGVSRPSLESMGASTLSGVSNEELDSGDVSSARVTIITNLPDSLYERLTQDRLVLKPLYASQHSELEGTCISVYPGGEYDRGELSNVSHHQIPSDDDEADSNNTSDVVGTYDNHANSV